MLEKLLTRLKQGHDDAVSDHEIQIAIAALLVALENSDGTDGPDEDTPIDEVLMVRYGLDRKSAEAIRRDGAAAELASLDTFEFTHILKSELDDRARADLIEDCWRVATTDRPANAAEIGYIGRMVHLLDVSEHAARAARQLGERN